MRIIPLKYDFCIKEVMENETVRKHFISDVLEIPFENIKTVRIMNTSLWKRYQKQKQGILDVQLELNDATKINIEMQLKQKKGWDKRTVFYLAKMFTADLRHGENYKKAKKCIAITILDFNIIDNREYHNKYMLRNRQGDIYTDVLELHTIELKKKPDKEHPCPLDEWHSLFNAKTEEDLDMIKAGTKNKGIIEAVKELKEISLTDNLRFAHELRLQAKRDREAEDEFVYEQGQENGIKIGREEGMKSLINSMRGINATDEQIVNALVKEYGISQKEAESRLRQ